MQDPYDNQNECLESRSTPRFLSSVKLIQRWWREKNNLSIRKDRFNKALRSVDICCICFCLLSDADSNSLFLCNKCRSNTPQASYSIPKLRALANIEAKYHAHFKELQRQREELLKQKEAMEAEKVEEERKIRRDIQQRRQLYRRQQKEKEEKREQEKKNYLLSLQLQTDESGKNVEIQSAKTLPRHSKSKNNIHKLKSTIKSSKGKDCTLAPAQAQHSSTKETSLTPTKLGENSNKSPLDVTRKSFQAHLRQIERCYSQDLTPLVNGQKSRHLIKSTCRRKSLHKLQAAKLEPLQIIHNNQTLDAANHPPKSICFNITNSLILTPTNITPKNAYSSLTHTTNSLTPEINPAPWTYLLEKQLFQVRKENEKCNYGSQELSTSVIEQPQYASVHRIITLPSNTHLFSMSSSPASMCTSDVTAVPKQKSWEYSSEKLNNILEKYNISVATATRTKATVDEKPITLST